MSDVVSEFPEDAVLLRNGHLYVRLIGVLRNTGIEKDTNKGFNLSLHPGGEDFQAVHTALMSRKDLGMPYAKIFPTIVSKKPRRRPQ